MRALLTSLLLTVLCGGSDAAPVKLIFDTDMGNDVDDAMALCMIHSLQKRGACELLAVTITKDHPQAAAFVDAVNTFYGYPDVPIGVVKGGATPEPGKFNLLAAAKNADGSLRYPHDLKSGHDAPEAVGLIPLESPRHVTEYGTRREARGRMTFLRWFLGLVTRKRQGHREGW